MYTYVRDTKCTKILSNSSRFFVIATDLITDPRSFSRALFDVWFFLPCVEVIPEHTDRAARIKQSRVKMMRLKAKVEGDPGRRIKERREERKREREKEKKKMPKDFQRFGNDNIEESEENFPLL